MRKIPEWWDKKPSNTSRLELLHQRKFVNLPDESYNLTGQPNGGVGPRDYFIASRFDKDKDGKLS